MANKEITATTAITGLDSRMDAAEASIVALDIRVDANDLAIATLDGRADSVDGTLTAYDTRLDALEAGGGGIGGIADGSLTLAKLVNTAQGSFLMRYSAGSGPWQAATGAQAAAQLPLFASGAKGLVPAAGVTPDATKFLNEAGAWAVPAGGGGGVTTYMPELASGAVARNITDALAEEIDFRSTGGTMENDNADQAKVVTLLAGAIPGQRIRGKRGGGTGGVLKLTSALVITRQVDLELDRGFTIRLDSTGAANAVEYNINYTQTEYDSSGSPNSSGDYRNTILRGGRIYINGAGNTGYALVINKSGSGHKAGVKTLIENMALTGGTNGVGGALLIDSTRTSATVADVETQWLIMSRLDLTGGVLIRGEDGTVMVDCMSQGAGRVKFDKTFGAFNWGIRGGAIVNSQGNIEIINGSQGQIENVQIERQGTGVQEWMVKVVGQDYPAQGNLFRGANIGGQNDGAGNSVTNLVMLERARKTEFDGVQWGVATNADLVLKVGDTGDPVANDTACTILHPNQRFRGARNMVGFGNMTDASRRMVIKTTSNRKFRTLQMGIWFPGFQYLTSPTAGYEDADLEFFITTEGIVHSRGGVRRQTGNGGLALNTSPGKLPPWLLPYTSDYIPVHTRTSNGVAWIVVDRDGAGVPNTSNPNLGLIELQNNWSAQEYLYFGSWEVSTEPDYVTVN